MWTQLKLKADEADYFCQQMCAHEKHPRIFLFYLSAFLTSSRSLTFHLQKQFKHKDTEKTYEKLREELLNNPECKYFVDLRNHIEKEGYPPIQVNFLVARKVEDSGNLVWYQLAGCGLFGGNEEVGFEFLDNLVRTEWDHASMSGIPAKIKYTYNFIGYPEERKSVTKACEEFMERLWYFIAKFRSEWESHNDPETWDRKFDAWLSVFGEK